jgi:3-oxoacyl-[acyl-carrier-protein] synthase-3
LPSTACWVQKKLGIPKAWATDLNSACSGFVYALTFADGLIRSGHSKRILVIGSEVLSPIVNWKDRSTSIIFGDGAGAAIVERTDPENLHRIYSCHMGSEGELWDLFYVPAGGSRTPATMEAQAQMLDKMHMKGREIFKEAVRTLVQYAEIALKENGLTVEDIQWVVPHQANLRILEAVAKRLNLPMSKMITNIDRFANTSAATVPTALDEGVRSGKIKKGDWVLLDVFGAGLTYGSVLMKW